MTGVAWELGLLAGLAERGAAVTEADLVVGTSAGSVVGAQVRSGVPLEQLYEEQLAPPTGEVAARLGSWRWRGWCGPVAAPVTRRRGPDGRRQRWWRTR
ncbi:patatin-like phospholipase family protein [Micromonospora parastrephiae]|uniref:patatin-like phospholipase family protein n=1 Tax=Micromonospora parastrephiae TaxID=2806101 RepID=UPI002815126D|nr:patatin-like phospholipase family protein [Micromonospora parastrephiae]